MNEMDQSQIQVRLDALEIVNEVFQAARDYLKQAHAKEESESEVDVDSHTEEDIEIDSETEEVHVNSGTEEEEAIKINNRTIIMDKESTEFTEPRLAVGETVTVPIRIIGPRNGRRVSFSDEIITVKAFGNNNNNIFKKPKILKKQFSSSSLPVPNPTSPAPVQQSVMKKSILSKEPSVEIMEITRL